MDTHKSASQDLRELDKYYTPMDYIFLTLSRTALQAAEISKDKKLIKESKDLVDKAEERELDLTKHQN